MALRSQMDLANKGYDCDVCYNFEVSLNIKKSFQDRAALFLSFIDNYKTPTADGALYSFKLTGSNLMAPPSMSALK